MGGDAKEKRAHYLKSLAHDPQQAIRHWRRLKPGEGDIVLNEMTRKYGADFAKAFKEQAGKKKRPDQYTMVTNVDYITPESLTKGGYKLRHVIDTISRLEIWVHPSGKEVWRISSPKDATPQPVKPQQPPPNTPPAHPDVEELEMYAEQYSKRKQELIDEARRLESSRGVFSKEQYDRQRKEWWKGFQSWDAEVDDIFDEIVPEMTGPYTPEDKRRKTDALDELRDLQAVWPADVMETSK